MDKESWASKNWCFWTVVLEKTLESSLNYKEIHPVHPKGDQSWVFTGRSDAKAESPILWPPDAEKDWRQEEKGTTGWDDWMSSLTQWTWVWVDSGSCDGQGGLACCSSWGCKELDMTERLNWAEQLVMLSIFSCAYWSFVYPLWRNIYSNPLSTF